MLAKPRNDPLPSIGHLPRLYLLLARIGRLRLRFGRLAVLTVVAVLQPRGQRHR